MRALALFAVLQCAAQALSSPQLEISDIESIERNHAHMSEATERCPKGKWAASWGCIPCSTCGNGMYSRSVCMPDKDTVCDWCLSDNPKRNADYEVKCADWIQVKEELDAIAEEKSRDSGSKPAAKWFVSETVLKVGFCLAVLALLLFAYHLVKKTRKSHRTVTIVAPLLDDYDSKDIIRAAECIRGKLGKKGYEHLEEFI